MNLLFQPCDGVDTCPAQGFGGIWGVCFGSLLRLLASLGKFIPPTLLRCRFISPPDPPCWPREVPVVAAEWVAQRRRGVERR